MRFREREREIGGIGAEQAKKRVGGENRHMITLYLYCGVHDNSRWALALFVSYTLVVIASNIGPRVILQT